ncbi:hypothetical protein B0H11DRAFT_2269084, partial [Mycena galericulata]
MLFPPSILNLYKVGLALSSIQFAVACFLFPFLPATLNSEKNRPSETRDFMVVVMLCSAAACLGWADLIWSLCYRSRRPPCNVAFHTYHLCFMGILW